VTGRLRLPERYEAPLATGLLIATFVFALVVQSLFFAESNAIRGDHAYHRGVAGTMVGGDWQGGGPLPGLLAYYGGLLPMLMAAGERTFGVSYDSMLSVISWFATLLLPAALFVLARSIWPGERLAQALLVFIGTVGSSLALDVRSQWVLSILPSGSNMWPLFPRDLAVVSLVFALGVAMGGRSVARAVGTGGILAAALLSQFQLGIVAIGAVTAWNLTRPRSSDGPSRLLVAAIAPAVAFVLTSWYWIPRLDAAIRYRPILIRNYPGAGAAPPDYSIPGLVTALGLVGVLAVIGAIGSWRQKDRGPVETFFFAWIVIFAPLLVLGTIAGDLGIITPRRIGQMVTLPIVVFAARGAIDLVSSRVGLIVVPVLVLALVGLSTAEAFQTRDYVERQWSNDTLGYEQFRDAAWGPTIDALRDRVRDDGPVTVLAPDNDAAHVWSETGAQPFSLQLPAVIKLGFEPRQATGTGYLERVRATADAFAEGRAGLCRLARRRDLDVAVLRSANELVAFHDLRPSARWRLAPVKRSETPMEREVAPGVRYVDRNIFEQVWLDRGAELPLGFSGRDIRMVDVEGVGGGAGAVPTVLLRAPSSEPLAPTTIRRGRTTTYRFRTPGGVPPGTMLYAQRDLRLLRVLGYEDPGEGIPAWTGPVSRPVLVTPAALCDAAERR
jgi:hypothetical protein